VTDSIQLDMVSGAEIVLAVMGEVGPRGIPGPPGDTGPAGVDGETVLYGDVDPTTEGADGDFYINKTTWVIFGPKGADAWPNGVSLVGPIGPDGPPGPRTVQLMASDPNGAVLDVGTGKAYWTVPLEMDGYKVSSVQTSVTTPSTSGLPAVQITNVTTASEILSTQSTIDADQTTSYTASTPSVVDPTSNTLATGDQLRVDVTDAGTGAKGLFALLTVSPT
jgi:hypothetical protein